MKKISRKKSHLPKNLKGPFTLLKRIAVTENMQKSKEEHSVKEIRKKLHSTEKFRRYRELYKNTKLLSCVTWVGTL